MILFFLTEKHDLVIIKFNFRKWDITMHSIFNISSKSNINFTVSEKQLKNAKGREWIYQEIISRL